MLVLILDTYLQVQALPRQRQLIAASLISLLHIVRGKYAARIHHNDNADASRHQRDRGGVAESQHQIIYQSNFLYYLE